jgi:hypothetical protein
LLSELRTDRTSREVFRRIRSGVAIAGIAGFLIGVAYVLVGAGYGIGTLATPGPAFYPVLVGCLIILGGLATLLEGVLGRDRPQAWPERPQLRLVALTFGAILGYVVAVPYTGHLYTSAVVAFFVLWLHGMRRWYLAAAVSGVLALGSELLFVSTLGVPLPPSPGVPAWI